MSTITKASPEDILRWPDGTTCTREEYSRGEFAHMSDDFEVITSEHPEYELLHHGNIERANFGCPVRRTGIYAPARAAVSDSLDTSEREALDP